MSCIQNQTFEKNDKLNVAKEVTKSDEMNTTLCQMEIELLRKLLHPNIVD